MCNLFNSSNLILKIEKKKKSNLQSLQVIVKDLPNDRIDTVIFDAVLVCNGHYNTPSIPNYPGQKLFKGQQIHSHDYRCPQPFKGINRRRHGCIIQKFDFRDLKFKCDR